MGRRTLIRAAQRNGIGIGNKSSTEDSDDSSMTRYVICDACGGPIKHHKKDGHMSNNKGVDDSSRQSNKIG